LLPEFASVIDAVRCAVEVQQANSRAEDRDRGGQPLELRIGINLGDVIVEGDDLYGDGATWRPGSKPWPMPAGCSSPKRFMTT
jgi:class 3 adenylate cyclase